MPELPEIRNLAVQIDGALCGAMIVAAETLQPKCLNRPPEEWKDLICGRRILSTRSKGKWCDIVLDGGVSMRLNLGMGGEFLLHEADETLPEKRRIALRMDDGRKVSVNFWWFGSLHAVRAGETHGEFDALGMDALDERLDEENFRKTYCSRKATIKSLLLNQKLICGIGNYYSHDILFQARIHPMRRGCDMSGEEYAGLYHAVRDTLTAATKMGGAHYEKDLYNRPGRWARYLVGYRAGEACPACGGMIEEIRTGATKGFICPRCQR